VGGTVKAPPTLSAETARRIWLRAQRLDEAEPFGAGPAATTAAVEHLGYVQIDTINVVERCHHHILFNRVPAYRRSDLRYAQSTDRTVFEYWTHALSYVPTRDLRFFLPNMRRHEREPDKWFAQVEPADYRRVLKLIRRDGAISIRDIEDEELREKVHPWASRKPSRAALQLGFFNGRLAVTAREGMVKTYDLFERHFPHRPRPAGEAQVTGYLLDRALRAQGIVSLDSVCHLAPKRKPAIRALIEARVRRKQLRPVALDSSRDLHWAAPETLDSVSEAKEPLTHILSPFDPLIIQRKRTSLILGYDHVFEAYVPKAKRRYGYFTLPVLHGEEIVALLDLKADRQAARLLVQAWHWTGPGDPALHKPAVEAALDRFQQFQLAVD
jgi:uncharacterized protein